MENLLKDYGIEIGDPKKTAVTEANGVFQDGTLPMYRDTDGTLWAISGHSHMGQIAMFRGTCVGDLEYAYPVRQMFATGHADYAFAGVRYPEGVKARGSIWPFALYICPKTHRFYSFFHNETGWQCMGTSYDAFGLCEIPKYDSDFRHIGMMHSDDEGRSWEFDRWVITGEKVCFTESYHPESSRVIGQEVGIVSLGSGDFSFFIDREGRYLYLFYNMIRVNMTEGGWDGCDVYVARTELRNDGIMGDFVKYYNGSFCEPGNLGRETAIVRNAWHPRVVYSEPLGCYLMTSVRVTPSRDGNLVDDVMSIRVGSNLTEWSDEIFVTKNGEPWGNHYVAFADVGKDGQTYVLRSNEFCVLTNHNATDVMNYPIKLVNGIV